MGVQGMTQQMGGYKDAWACAWVVKRWVDTRVDEMVPGWLKGGWVSG